MKSIKKALKIIVDVLTLKMTMIIIISLGVLSVLFPDYDILWECFIGLNCISIFIAVWVFIKTYYD